MTLQSVSIHGVYFDIQGKVLLVKDSHSSLWGFPGGGVEEGETHADTLHREFLEETGMNAIGSHQYITQQDDGAKQRYFYKVEAVEGSLSEKGNGSDIECSAYFSVNDLPTHYLAPGIKMIIELSQQP